MSELSKIYLYRMTHIENLPHIIEHGITHINSSNANKNYTPIGDSSLINTRNNIELNNKKRLGEYIPFYFGTRTPMLFVVQKGFNGVNAIAPEKIVYCVTSVKKMIELPIDYIFTDGHYYTVWL